MSREIEIFLNRLTEEENILLGIHRVGPYASPDKIEDILTNGLEIPVTVKGQPNIVKV